MKPTAVYVIDINKARMQVDIHTTMALAINRPIVAAKPFLFFFSSIIKPP
jgi:hypothetical protein